MALTQIATVATQSVWSATAQGTGSREYLSTGALTGAGYLVNSEIRLPAGIYEVEVYAVKPVTELNIRHRVPGGAIELYTSKDSALVRGIVQDEREVFIQAPLTCSEPTRVWLVARKIA